MAALVAAIHAAPLSHRAIVMDISALYGGSGVLVDGRVKPGQDAEPSGV